MLPLETGFTLWPLVWKASRPMPGLCRIFLRRGRIVVGNDIVDLHFVDQPPYQHVGHPERVCTTEELRYIYEAEKPSMTLAALWASKEATYKLFSRETRFPFVPKQFVVRFNNPSRLTTSETAMVSHGGIATRVELSVSEKWIHATSISQVAQIVRWKVREIETTSPDGLQPQDESEAVRSLATELTSMYCQEDVRHGLRGRTPFLINETGRDVPIEISFSHHGKFAAVAMAWPIGGRGQLSRGPGFARKNSPWGETCSTYTA